MVLQVHLLGFVQYVNYHLIQLYYLWVERADQKHVNNLNLLRAKNNVRRTRENFKYILNNYHGARGFALLARSLLIEIHYSCLQRSLLIFGHS